MRDFRGYVVQNLPPLAVSGADESAIVEEIAQELEDRYDDLISEGLDPDEAWTAVQSQVDWPRLSLDIGASSGDANRQTTWCVQKPGPFHQVMGRLWIRLRSLTGIRGRDLRFASRMLRTEPGFFTTAVVTLGLCLGANLAIFAVVDAILVRSLPYPESDRLVTLYSSYPGAGVDRAGSSVTNYYERRGKVPALSHLALYGPGTAIVGDAGSARREDVIRVSPEFFAALGVGPVLGRAFSDDEMTHQTDNVVILSDAVWREHFSADPGAIGRRLRVNGESMSIVGVLPPGFRFTSFRARLYLPLSSGPVERAVDRRHNVGFEMVARLAPGATLADAQAQVDARDAALQQASPSVGGGPETGFRTVVVPLRSDHVSAIRPTLILLQTGALLLVLIACVNLANLLLIRANRRARDWAVRRALGAHLLHVLRQAASESFILSAAGGLLGLLVGVGGVRLITLLGVDRLPLGSSVGFGGRVIWAALLGSLVVGLALAVPIAWFNSRKDPAVALRSESRSSSAGPAARRLRHGFIVGQIGLSFVLLSAAGLLGISLQRTLAVSPGFRPDHLLTGRISIPLNSYGDADARVAVTNRLLADLEHQPGVTAAGLTTNLPMSGKLDKLVFAIAGRPPKPDDTVRGHYQYYVSGNLLAAMGFSLLEGRFLTSEDSSRGDRVCVVDEGFAHRYWPKGGALGERLFRGAEQRTDAEAFEIVGVIDSVKQAELTELDGQGAVYLPYRYQAQDEVHLAIRTDRQPHAVASTVRHVVREIDPELPVTDLRSMDERIEDSLIGRRSSAILVAIFAAVAVLLAAVGTFGVLSYTVAQSRRAIGVRMALGAAPSRILTHFLRLGTKLLAAGVVPGVLGAWVAGRSMRNLLFAVGPGNLGVLTATAGMMCGVVLLATTLPAYRASCIAVADALRDE